MPPFSHPKFLPILMALLFTVLWLTPRQTLAEPQYDSQGQPFVIARAACKSVESLMEVLSTPQEVRDVAAQQKVDTKECIAFPEPIMAYVARKVGTTIIPSFMDGITGAITIWEVASEPGRPPSAQKWFIYEAYPFNGQSAIRGPPRLSVLARARS